MQAFKISSLIVFLFSVAAATFAFFSVVGGLFSVVAVVASAIILFIGMKRREFVWGIASLIVGLFGIAFAAIATLNMQGSVKDNCGDLNPYSDVGIECFNQNYNSSWGLYHILLEER